MSMIRHTVEPVEATPRKAMTPARKREVLEAYGRFCEACGASLTTKLEIDHRIQLWMGGPEDLANLRPLCIPCHKVKTAQDAAERAHVKRIHQKHFGERKPSRLKSRGFDQRLTKGFDGQVRERDGSGTKPFYQDNRQRIGGKPR